MWWAVMLCAVAALARHAGREPGVVTGSAMLGLFVGMGMALFRPGVDVVLMARAVAVGALIGWLRAAWTRAGSSRKAMRGRRTRGEAARP